MCDEKKPSIEDDLETIGPIRRARAFFGDGLLERLDQVQQELARLLEDLAPPPVEPGRDGK